MKFYYDKEFGVVGWSPNCANECLHQIWICGTIYNEVESSSGLKNIIDNIIDLSQDARQFISEGKISKDDPEVKKEETETYKSARKEEQADMNSMYRCRQCKENKNENLGG